MNALSDTNTDELLRQARSGDDAARNQLLQRHRDRIRRAVEVRIDRRLASRVDPSDIVQEALITANRRLGDYLQREIKPVAFYPWLRAIVLNQLANVHRHHIHTDKRSLAREFNDGSISLLTNQLSTGKLSPSKRVEQSELRRRVHKALQQLPAEHREIVIMRHLEELSVNEIATILDIPAGTVMSKHFRALLELRETIDG